MAKNKFKLKWIEKRISNAKEAIEKYSNPYNLSPLERRIGCVPERLVEEWEKTLKELESQKAILICV